MQWLRPSFVFLLCTLLGTLQPLSAMSAEMASPPTAYRLEAVKLRLQRLPAQGQPKQVLEVTGAGGGTLESGRPSETRGFTVPAEEVMAMLNGLYRLRFFDLPAVLRSRPSVFLLPDGMVGTQTANKMDSTSNTVCVALPGYEKCVRFTENEGPPELEAWVLGAFADALRRTQPAAPKK